MIGRKPAQDAPRTSRGLLTLPNTLEENTDEPRPVLGDILGAVFWTALLIGLMAI